MTLTFKRILAPVASLWIFNSCATQAADFDEVGRGMARMLMNAHFESVRIGFDEKLSQRVFNDFINDLDPEHLYFLQSDIDEFRGKYENRLHEALLNRKSVAVSTDIYKRYQTRVRERVEMINDILENEKFTYNGDRWIMRDREKAPWPKNNEEARQLWSDQLEAAVLSELIRRDEIEKRAKELGKENPLAKELSPKDKISKRYARLQRTILDADAEDMANFFLSAVARAYDPHTEYLSAREMDRFRSGMQNKLVGIGALLQAEDDGATEIRGIVVGGPAEKQGELQLKDRVVAVDSNNSGEFTDIMFMELDKVVELIRGQVGVKVALKVEPADGAPGETKIIVIKRDEVELKDEQASAELIELKHEDKVWKIGIIDLPSFYFDFQTGETSCSRDVRKLLLRLKKENINGLIFDLRGNGGGSLDEVRRITGFFNGKGPVVRIKTSGGNLDSKNSASAKPIYDGPLVVLTDKSSASASEILAGALQDYNRAVVVGDSSTFGKGTVQQPLDIAESIPVFANADRAGFLKATIQKFYRVSGSSTQLVGVVPDIVLPSVTDALEFGEAHLDHALKHDVIGKAPSFKPFNRRNLFLPALQEMSEKRIKKSEDYDYIKEDYTRLKKRFEDNKISLNLEMRQKEINENEMRRKERNTERRGRFDAVEKMDQEKYRFFKLTLENADKGPLTEFDPMEKDESHMRRAKDELEDLNDTPEWPSGLDPVKREGIAILTDLVDFVEAGKLAGVLRKP